jgi:hypothetical protein
MSLTDACAAALSKHISASLYTNGPKFNALKPEIKLVKLSE